MSYSNYIEPTEESINQLNKKFSSLTDDRFMYCLKEGKWTLEDIARFKSSLEVAYDYTTLEYGRLDEFSKTFNKEYATNHNKYFSAAAQLMSKMRSTLSEYKTIIYAFRDGKGKRRGYDVSHLPGIDHCALVGGCYSQDMFGMKVFDERVQELYDILKGYLNDANKSLKLCLKVIEEEKKIRSTRELYMPLYDHCYQRTFHNNRVTIKNLEKASVSYDNEYVEAMENAKDVEKMIAELFHVLNVAEWNDFVISKGVHDAQKMGMTKEEILLWGKDNKEKVMRVRVLLSHIEELDKQMSITIHQGKLSGAFLLQLFKWCDIVNPSKCRTLLQYVSQSVQGKFETAKIGAVNNEKRKQVDIPNKELNNRQMEFNRQIDAFIDDVIARQFREAN